VFARATGIAEGADGILAQVSSIAPYGAGQFEPSRTAHRADYVDSEIGRS